MSAGAPLRSVRVSDELWAAAAERAAREDITLSQLLRRWLTYYVANGDPVPMAELLAQQRSGKRGR